MNKLNPIIEKIKSIETIKDLNKNKLNLCDYNEIIEILNEMIYLYNNNLKIQAETINSNVCFWFHKNGIKTQKHGIGYLITL